MPAPGTSGKSPATMKMVTGQRSFTARSRERKITSAAAQKIAAVRPPEGVDQLECRPSGPADQPAPEVVPRGR